MRILLDENVPHPLMRFFAGHEVSTVQDCGWRGVLNAELLRLAEESFDVFVLADKNMRYQQNLDGRNIARGAKRWRFVRMPLIWRQLARSLANRFMPEVAPNCRFCL